MRRVWSSWRELQSVHRYRRLLNEARQAKPFGPSELAATIRVRRNGKRAFDRQPHFAIFGAMEWERYGFWQAFEELGRSSFYDYSHVAKKAAGPSAALRTELGRAFLEFVTRANDVHPVNVAFLYASGAWIDPALLLELSRRGVWTVLMGLDDKQQIPGPRLGDLKGWQLEAAQAADVYWTTWRSGVEWLASAGVRPWYAPEAASPAFFVAPNKERDIDVLWVGRGYGPRHGLVEALRSMGFQVQAYGPGWPGGLVPFDRMLDLYGRSRVVLGMGGVGHTDRIKHLKGRDFEVPMSGAVYVTSFNPELADYFEIGKEILCYASPEECAEVVSWILHRPDLQQAVREAARARCLRDHTWTHRVSSLLSLLRPS